MGEVVRNYSEKVVEEPQFMDFIGEFGHPGSPINPKLKCLALKCHG